MSKVRLYSLISNVSLGIGLIAMIACILGSCLLGPLLILAYAVPFALSAPPLILDKPIKRLSRTSLEAGYCPLCEHPITNTPVGGYACSNCLRQYYSTGRQHGSRLPKQ